MKTTLPPPAREGALCAETDPEIFFPVKGAGSSGNNLVAARKVCSRCELQVACAEWAIDNEERHGIWGGLSQQQRYKIKLAKDAV